MGGDARIHDADDLVIKPPHAGDETADVMVTVKTLVIVISFRSRRGKIRLDDEGLAAAH